MDPDFEAVASEWFNECESNFSDQDDDVQDPDYYSDHDSASEIENEAADDSVSDDEELQEENGRAYYGKDRFKWSMTGN